MRRVRASSKKARAMPNATHAALGFRAHSGWAVVVAVAGTPDSPAVIDRQRIELIAPGIPKQPYHAAEKLDLKAAEKLVGRCAQTAERLARRAVRAVVDDLRRKRHEVVGCGILLASGRPRTTLAATLASHALIHTAEGELFRDALARASEHWGLAVTAIRERELYERGATEFQVAADELRLRVAEMGRAVGPPWTQDEKQAALVGWLALVAASQR